MNTSNSIENKPPIVEPLDDQPIHILYQSTQIQEDLELESKIESLKDRMNVGMLSEMAETMRDLNDHHGFGFVNLHLTEEETEALKNFSFSMNPNEIHSYSTRSFERLKTTLPDFLRSVGNGDITTITVTIYRIFLHVVTASSLPIKQVRIELRAFMPTHAYDMPRWHIDGGTDMEHNIKFAAALIGKPTRFYPISQEKREAFKELEDKEQEKPASSINFREERCALLPEEGTVEAKPGEGSFFRVGSRLQFLRKACGLNLPFSVKELDSEGFDAKLLCGDSSIGAVHSEPKIDSPRLFISILVKN